VHAQGVGGVLRVGYIEAAQIGAWSMTLIPTLPMSRHAVHAALTRVDRFWITQRPIAVDLYVGRWRWRWRSCTDCVLTLAMDAVDLVVVDAPSMAKEHEDE